MHNLKLPFLNLISPIKSNQVLTLSELPSSKSAINHVVSYHYGLVTNNNVLIDVLNPYKVPIEKMSSKVIDVLYTSVKERNIVPNINLDKDLPVGAVEICRLQLDMTKSIYFSDGIYNNPLLIDKIKAISSHPCKVLRLGDGKMLIFHLTHNYPDMNGATFISGIDLQGKKRGQSMSNMGIEIDENMIVNFSLYQPNPNSIEVHNLIKYSNYPVSKYSEMSFFHNMTNKNYDSSLYSELKKELNVDLIDAMELFNVFSR